MKQLENKFYLISIKMPGVGKTDQINSYDKRYIAPFTNTLILDFELDNFFSIGF